jgi:hypothetical protein
VTGELRAPAIFAWLFFVPGVVFVTVDIVRLEITGLFLLGVVFLVLWFWLLDGFTREFWVADIAGTHPDALGSLDLAEQGVQR